MNEHVAIVASVRIVNESGSASIPLQQGTAVLTSTRFLLIDHSSPSRPPKSTLVLHEKIRLEFLRTNITEISPFQEGKQGVLLRYYDGSEKKILFKPGNDGEKLINLIEQDLSGG